MHHLIIDKLKAYTDTIEFERMCVDVLKRNGFTDIVPRGPGLRDSGVDAYSLFSPKYRIFQFSVAKKWNDKLFDTIEKLVNNKCLKKRGSIVFVTNQKVSPYKNDAIKNEIWDNFRFRAEILDREWLRVQLDANQDIRAKYFQINVDQGYKKGTYNYASEIFIHSLSIEDFIRHIMNLALIRNQSWHNISKFFCFNRILKYINNELDDKENLKLFPMDPDQSVVEIKNAMDKKRKIIKIKAYRVLTEHYKLNNEPILCFPIKKNKKIAYSITWVRGGLLVEEATDFLLSVTSSCLIVIFMKNCLYGFGLELMENKNIDSSKISDLEDNINKLVTSIIANNLVNYLKKYNNLNSLYFLIGHIYQYRLYGITDDFLFEIIRLAGRKYIEKIIIKETDKDLIYNTLGLLFDDCIPYKYYKSACDAAKKNGVVYGEFNGGTVEDIKKKQEMNKKRHNK